MKSIVVGLAILIIASVAWSCVHINVSDGDLSADTDVAGIHNEPDTNNDNLDIESNMYKE
jgi:hypothetical protein